MSQAKGVLYESLVLIVTLGKSETYKETIKEKSTILPYSYRYRLLLWGYSYDNPCFLWPLLLCTVAGEGWSGRDEGGQVRRGVAGWGTVGRHQGFIRVPPMLRMQHCRNPDTVLYCE